MSDDSSKTKKLSLSGGKLTLGNVDASKLRAGPAVGGARKTVQVEVRRKRAPAAPPRGGVVAPEPVVEQPVVAPFAPVETPAVSADDKLTTQERAARVRALQEGMRKPDDALSETSAQTASDSNAENVAGNLAEAEVFPMS